MSQLNIAGDGSSSQRVLMRTRVAHLFIVKRGLNSTPAQKESFFPAKIAKPPFPLRNCYFGGNLPIRSPFSTLQHSKWIWPRSSAQSSPSLGTVDSHLRVRSPFSPLKHSKWVQTGLPTRVVAREFSVLGGIWENFLWSWQLIENCLTFCKILFDFAIFYIWVLGARL